MECSACIACDGCMPILFRRSTFLFPLLSLVILSDFCEAFVTKCAWKFKVFIELMSPLGSPSWFACWYFIQGSATSNSNWCWCYLLLVTSMICTIASSYRVVNVIVVVKILSHLNRRNTSGNLLLYLPHVQSREGLCYYISLSYRVKFSIPRRQMLQWFARIWSESAGKPCPCLIQDNGSPGCWNVLFGLLNVGYVLVVVKLMVVLMFCALISDHRN